MLADVLRCYLAPHSTCMFFLLFLFIHYHVCLYEFFLKSFVSALLPSCSILLAILSWFLAAPSSSYLSSFFLPPPDSNKGSDLALTKKTWLQPSLPWSFLVLWKSIFSNCCYVIIQWFSFHYCSLFALGLYDFNWLYRYSVHVRNRVTC